jgi:hypothetical protein
MGELLGLGLSHSPIFQYPDENMAHVLKADLGGDKLPAELKDVRNWPTPMREEWGDDEGLRSARRHRDIVVNGFRQLREELDAFQPDFVLIWGDDQYENFKEDMVPSFSVLMYDEVECFPYRRSARFNVPNIWNLPEDQPVRVRGHRDAASYLAQQLLRNDFDIAYAFKPHHHPALPHAFINTVLYLDYDRQGFDYPVIPFAVNCYGVDLFRNRPDVLSSGLIPPAPTPRRCFDLGQAVAGILAESPWRVALVGSSSWSHAFLTRKHHGLYPDVASDRQRLEDLQAGRHRQWRDLDLATVVDAGQHEFLNWVCLAGAMADRRAEVLAYGESWIFNSDKAAAIFLPHLPLSPTGRA